MRPEGRRASAAPPSGPSGLGLTITWRSLSAGKAGAYIIGELDNRRFYRGSVNGLRQPTNPTPGAASWSQNTIMNLLRGGDGGRLC